MHAAAFAYVRDHANLTASRVVECGGRDINGTVRGLFTDAAYTSVDLASGPGVDVVGDFLDFQPDSPPDVVVCLEVLEHVKKWSALIEHAADILAPGGQLVVTAAGPCRPPHSAVDGGEVRDGEWYQNIKPASLRTALSKRFEAVEVEEHGDDVRAVATKGATNGTR